LNYVNDWNYGPATNVYDYNGQEVYCTASQLFEIVTVQMKDGSVYKINPEYQKPSDAPDYIKSIGSRVKYVECCPQEPNCGSDFKWTEEEVDPEKECWTDAQCHNAGNPVPYSSTSYVEYLCGTDGRCVESEPITVQCTSNAGCDPGQVCDLSITNYGNCIQQSGTPYCGDSFCATTESEESCPTDCAVPPSSVPWWFYVLVTIAGMIILGGLILVIVFIINKLR